MVVRMGCLPMMLVLPAVLTQHAQPVPRINVDDTAALTRHFVARSPVVVLNTAAPDVVAHWQPKALAARFPAEKVVVITMPKTWRDNRATNQLHIDAKHIDEMREVRMPFADYAELLARSDKVGQRGGEEGEAAGDIETGRRRRRRQTADTASGQGTDGWKWDNQHVYVRHRMPSDYRGDSLGPALHSLLVADFPARAPLPAQSRSDGDGGDLGNAGQLPGVIGIQIDGSLAVHDTKIRSGSAGLYYPAHSDCYHNMLLVTQGRRRVRLMDQSVVWRTRSSIGASEFRAILRLKSLDNTSVATTWARMTREHRETSTLDQSGAREANDGAATAGLVVWETVLESGEALYIPPTWLHDVYYIDSGMGINQFYDSPPRTHRQEEKPAVLNGVQAEVQLCRYLKARLDESRRDSSARSGAAKSVEQELGSEVGQMLEEVDAVIASHRARVLGPPEIPTASMQEL